MNPSRCSDPACVETRGALFGLMEALVRWMDTRSPEAEDVLADAMALVNDLVGGRAHGRATD